MATILKELRIVELGFKNKRTLIPQLLAFDRKSERIE
jgi:hypothetical protein